jgi:restriction system protein
VRKVEWKGTVSRDNLSTSTRNTLGAISTLFDAGEDVEKEIFNLLAGQTAAVGITPRHEDEQLEQYREDIVEKAREFIKDKILALDWDDAQELTAGILRAMSYKTRVSPPGADRGRDVEASPDGLGFNEPRIVAQVKHRGGQMGAPEVSSFLGRLRPGHKALYVSTGGFTREGKYEAERSNIPTTLIDLDGLVDLIIQYYDNFDAETRVLVPLTKIYWPK